MSSRQRLGQLLFWALFMLPVLWLAQRPRYLPVPLDHGELKLSVAHLTERLQPCRPLSAEERAALPPNMRAFERCERERAPARLRLTLAGQPLLDTAVEPVGLHRDGRAYLFQRWSLPAGRYPLQLELADSARSQGYDHQHRFELELAAGRSAQLQVSDGGARLLAANGDAHAP